MNWLPVGARSELGEAQGYFHESCVHVNMTVNLKTLKANTRRAENTASTPSSTPPSASHPPEAPLFAGVCLQSQSELSLSGRAAEHRAVAQMRCPAQSSRSRARRCAWGCLATLRPHQSNTIWTRMLFRLCSNGAFLRDPPLHAKDTSTHTPQEGPSTVQSACWESSWLEATREKLQTMR